MNTKERYKGNRIYNTIDDIQKEKFIKIVFIILFHNLEKLSLNKNVKISNFILMISENGEFIQIETKKWWISIQLKQSLNISASTTECPILSDWNFIYIHIWYLIRYIYLGIYFYSSNQLTTFSVIFLFDLDQFITRHFLHLAFIFVSFRIRSANLVTSDTVAKVVTLHGALTPRRQTVDRRNTLSAEVAHLLRARVFRFWRENITAPDWVSITQQRNNVGYEN